MAKQRITSSINFSVIQFTLLLLLLLGLIVASGGIVYYFEKQQSEDTAVVDAAGRNRMLSQRIALLATQVLDDDTSKQGLLEEQITLHDTSLRALKNGGVAPGINENYPLPPSDPQILSTIISVEQLWEQYQAAALTIADTTVAQTSSTLAMRTEALLFLEDHAADMLARNDALVKSYVAINKQKQIQFAQSIAAAVVINMLTILFIFYRIYRLIRTNIDQAKHLRQENKKRKQSEQDLKEQESVLRKEQHKLEKQKGAMLNILEDLEESNAKFEGAFEGAPIGIALVSPKGEWLAVNDALPNIVGYSKDELMQKTFQDITYPDDLDDDLELFEEVIAGKRNSYQMDKRYIHKLGYVVWVSLSVSAVRNKDGSIKYFISQILDVSKQKEIDQAKTEFVSLASHQLRTPLSAINWYAELLLDDASALTDEQREYIHEIYTGNKRMVDLVNALLNVSRLELGTFSVEPEPTNPRTLLLDVIKEETPNIKKKGIKVKKEISQIRTKVPLDPKLMWIVFQNLLSNAVKYTPADGSVTVTLKSIRKGVTVGGKKIDDAAYVYQVSDTGYGIPKDQQGQIFKKLFRASNVQIKDVGGTGLGLYIVKSIMTNTGGDVWFESKENKGTNFYVLIPKTGMTAKEGTKKLN